MMSIAEKTIVKNHSLRWRLTAEEGKMKKTVQFSLSERTQLIIIALATIYGNTRSQVIEDAMEEIASKEDGLEELIEMLASKIK
jgi:hypothetical protein